MKLQSKTFLPVEIVFTPNWWHKNYNISFTEDYFFDPKKRVAMEQLMERSLFERFGEYGIGEENPQERPMIGPVHLAAGFMISVMWGCDVEYYPDASPQVKAKEFTLDELLAMDLPDLDTSPIWQKFVKMTNALKAEYGYLEGDIGWHSLQNLALDLMGQQLFMSYYDEPEKIKQLYSKLNHSVIEIVNYIRKLSKTTSISVNRTVRLIEPALNVNSNCSVQMISNEIYEDMLLPFENELSKHFQPYGVHHCGTNMHNVAKGYSKIKDCSFFDVGWGSDVKECRKWIPDSFFNLRLSPIEIMRDTPKDVSRKIKQLIHSAGKLENIGVCCINMDYGTPDENIAAIYETVNKIKNAGA